MKWNEVVIKTIKFTEKYRISVAGHLDVSVYGRR